MNHDSLSEKKFRSGFVAIMGRPNVGKSTLLNSVLGQKIAITSNKPQTTRNRILGICNRPDAQLLFLDTPGVHKAKGLLNRYMVDQALSTCGDVDVVLMLVEANDSPGGGDDYVLEQVTRSKVPVILVVNKCDLVHRPDLLPLIEAYARRYAFSEIIPVSALTGEGIEEMVSALIKYLPAGPLYYGEDMVTDLSERFIVAEMIREQVLKQTHQEIPHGVAVEVDRFEEKPEKNLVVIEASIYVSREGHKKIILGRRGEKIKGIGKAARYDIERMLGTRVFLDLLVKVEKNWTEERRQLKRFGYE
ncbi:MAG: GTPase [Desulfuromonadales bacterium]|nr:GTPase [Desulfuromonadales bacterium]